MATTTPKATRRASIRGRAWRLLRLAALRARKGIVVHGLGLLKTLGCSGRSDRLRYGEREFSIDETPAFRFRAPSALVLRFIPCIAPAVPDTPDDYSGDRYFFCDPRERVAGSVGDGHGAGPSEYGVENLDDCAEEQLLQRAVMGASCADFGAVEQEDGEDAGVDVKAEEFIANFYSQMRMQRQISSLQYNEMMHRSIC
ncbi:uncharacterized protein LOC125553917 [Triticum urartu]|uniref:uncharacterized protein LOC125553917 n=1 Tax=Triticum urartu TaxID=4572 RepID=UPI002042FA4B|nr:uncharacterized protein LOC125553917 [Triticum urartu]